MFIYWGTKSYRARDGFAGDFCPICRQMCAVEVQEIRSQSHVYGIGMGKGKAVGHVETCTQCGSEWALQAGTVQRTVNPTTTVSVEEMLTETFPRWSIVHGERLEQEEALRRDPFSLDAQTRLNLIAEPFFVLDNEVERESHRTTASGTFGGLGCLVGVALALGAIIALLAGGIGVGIGLIVASAVLIWGSQRLIGIGTDRFMHRAIYPKLASCLAPLRPTEEELTIVQQNIKAKSASQTKLAEFLPLLASAGEANRQAQPNR